MSEERSSRVESLRRRSRRKVAFVTNRASGELDFDVDIDRYIPRSSLRELEVHSAPLCKVVFANVDVRAVRFNDRSDIARF